jgi:hypothetical protein
MWDQEVFEHLTRNIETERVLLAELLDAMIDRQSRATTYAPYC